MEKILTFVKPKNEATVKFYTEVLKNRLGIEPNPFLPKKSAQALITRCLSLTQFNLHSQKKNWMFHGDVFDASVHHSKWIAKLGGKGYNLLIAIHNIVNCNQ